MRVGIAGLGFMGATHITALSKMPDVTIAAVSGGNEKRLNGDLRDVGGNLGFTFGVHDFSDVRKHRDWTSLVADQGLDLVDICLPTEAHAPATEAALRAGKHVLCEKPMALTATDCDAMLAAAREHEKVLMIGQVLRFFPAYRRLYHAVQEQEFGAIRSATFVRQAGLPQWSKWLPDETRSGGAVLDLLVHDIDQALWIFGTPERVAAKSIGGPDSIMATLIYPGGPEVRIQGGWFAPESPFSMSFQVRFERAELDMNAAGVFVNDSTGQRRQLTLEDGDPYYAQIDYFVDCCRKGIQPDLCMPVESARAVKVALLLKQSRSEGGTQISCSV